MANVRASTAEKRGAVRPAGARRRSSRAAPRRAIFTIASANYIAYAATLMQSVRAAEPDAARFIILADTPRSFAGLDLAATVIGCETLGIATLPAMQRLYSVLEFNTALKPFAFRHMFETLGFAEACYLDPDILVLAPLAPALDPLAQHSVVLTPHLSAPLDDGLEPSDLTILQSGVYNLGFAAMRDDADARRLLLWWGERCRLHCRVDLARHMFTDQRWMDLAPSFVPRLAILHHPGCNVAYWNLAHRMVETGADGAWRVNGEPLIFFHFSGLVPDDERLLSRHESRFRDAVPAPAAALARRYRDLLHANGWRRTRSLTYGFGSFADGRPIEPAMRRWLVRAVDEGRLDPATGLDVPSGFFDAPDETAAARGIALTRFMYQTWLDRADLRTVFDIHTEPGLDAYYTWFLGGDAAAEGVDGRSIAAARALRGGADPGAPALITARPPPWPSLAVEMWPGAASDALQLLHGDVSLPLGELALLLPRQAALSWERRPDLQAHFDLTRSERARAFLGWVITAAIDEGSVDPALFTDAFVAQISRGSYIAAQYGDMPLNEGMLLTREVQAHRANLARWQDFPTDRSARLSHGLWYAFLAARAYRWPSPMVAELRRYFAELTDISVLGFRFNRAEMALWETRADVQSAFPLADEDQRLGYLHWLVTSGLSELGLTLDAFDPRLAEFLAGPSPRLEGLPVALEMVRNTRPDLRALFDVATETGRTELAAWAKQNFASSYADYPLGTLFARDLAQPAVIAPVHRARIGLTGWWRESTGRGEDVRATARALEAVAFTDWLGVDRADGSILRPDGTALPAGVRVEFEANILHLNAITAVEDVLFLRQHGVTAARSIGYWAWELEWLPRSWRHAYSFFDEIWAATEFARDAFAHAGLRPVRRVPMPVLPPAHEPRADRTVLGLPEDATVFLFMFDFRSYASRKNPEAVVQAFRTAFPTGEEPVQLLIKTQGGASTPLAWRALADLCDDPRIALRDVVLDRAAVFDLIAAADAFVSLHRSEGFGRGPAEAMLLGRPVIVTGYSGTADFATQDCAYVVDYHLVPVAPGEYPGAEGQSWAEADVEQAAAHMRHVHEDKAAARAIGRAGQARIAALYNPGHVGEAILAAIEQGMPRRMRPG